MLGYFVDGRQIDASEIQHRKANVDANVRRGLPLFFPVRKNLRRAEKLLRNMSVVAEIQSAIALIRKHHGGQRGAVQQFVSGTADVTVGQSAHRPDDQFSPLRPRHDSRRPGRHRLRLSRRGARRGAFVAVLQAELRAIAAGW